MRRILLVLLIASSGNAAFSQTAYRSPYGVEYRYRQLSADLERGERGNLRIEADIPHGEWYSWRTRERWGVWGPGPRAYPPLRGLESWPVESKRERVIAVALRFQGYGYQHHHIPDWDPPRDWPWKKTGVGHNGKGVDCRNFTGFVYNLGYGLGLNTDVTRQAEERYARVHHGGGVVPLRRIELPESYNARIKTLRTGDVLFIRNRSGHISHVVLWVGSIGRSPDGTPLVLDSHGEDVRDCEGTLIPAGIRLRPFREDSWYNMSASHALRVIEGE